MNADTNHPESLTALLLPDICAHLRNPRLKSEDRSRRPLVAFLPPLSVLSVLSVVKNSQPDPNPGLPQMAQMNADKNSPV